MHSYSNSWNYHRNWCYIIPSESTTEIRTLSGSVAGQLVTAAPKDRFGNPVPGVTVYATKTGAGYFGAGTTKTSGTTDTLGTVDFVITGGSADVKVSTLSYSATAGTCPSGQTGALKGNADCTADPADATAFTASTAGTTVIDPEMSIDVVIGEPREWTPGPTISNNFGFGGHNGSVIIAPYKQ